PVRRLPFPGELLRLHKGLIRTTLPSRLLPWVSSWLLSRIPSRLLPRIPCWLLPRVSSRLLPGISYWLLPRSTRLGLRGRRLVHLGLGSHIVRVVVIPPCRNDKGRY